MGPSLAMNPVVSGGQTLTVVSPDGNLGTTMEYLFNCATPSSGTGTFTMTTTYTPQQVGVQVGKAHTYSFSGSTTAQTATGTVEVCAIWLPIGTSVTTGGTTVELQDVYLSTNAVGAASSATTVTYTLSRITATGTTCTNGSTPTPWDLGSPASVVSTYAGNCAASPVGGNTYVTNALPFPTGGLQVGGMLNDSSNKFWSAASSTGRPITLRPGVGEGVMVTTANTAALSTAQKFNCTFVWTER